MRYLYYFLADITAYFLRIEQLTTSSLLKIVVSIGDVGEFHQQVQGIF